MPTTITDRSDTTPVTFPAPPRAARRVLTGYYGGHGVVMAVWGARMPAVQAAAQLSPGHLAEVLFAAAASMVAGLHLGGRLAHRHGPARLLTGPAVALGLTLAVLGQCHSLPALAAAAALFGAVQGLLIVAMNSSAVACQDAFRRRINSRMHAAFSVGGLAGAALAAATAHLPHQLLFAGTGALAATAALATAPAIRSVAELDGPAASTTSAAPSRPARTARPPIGLLGAMAAGCLLGEGAAADWAAVHLHTTLNASATVAAVAYALYCAAMAIGRLTGDRLTDRYGPIALVRTGAGLAAAGLGAGLALDAVPAALIGWTVFGLGLSIVVPTVYTAAGRGGPRALAAVAITGNFGMLGGPAAIGALASLSSLPAALLLPAALAAAVAAASRRALEPTR